MHACMFVGISTVDVAGQLCIYACIPILTCLPPYVVCVLYVCVSKCLCDCVK